MAELSEKDKQRIADELTKRGATRACPRCGQSQFTVLDGYFNHPIQGELSGNLVIGGPSIPVAVVVCNNCGFLSEHALGALGLLPKETK